MGDWGPGNRAEQCTCAVCSALPFDDGRGRHRGAVNGGRWIWETPSAVYLYHPEIRGAHHVVVRGEVLVVHGHALPSDVPSCFVHGDLHGNVGSR